MMPPTTSAAASSDASRSSPGEPRGAPTPPRTDDGWQALGTAIRERRRAQGLTMVALAERCELSQPFLSQVENGRATPSMDSLYRIARALDTTPQALFGSGAGGPTVVRAASSRGSVGVGEVGSAGESHGIPVLGRGADSAVRLLLPGDAPFHVLEFVGLPAEFQEPWSHDGFEAVYVLAGEVEIDLAGERTVLRAGDFASYPATVPHRHRAVSGPGARLLMLESAHTA